MYKQVITLLIVMLLSYTFINYALTDQGTKVLVNYGFEPGETKDWIIPGWATITDKKEEVISGKASLKADSRGSKEEWHEFFHSNPTKLSFEKNKKYTVSFDYKVLDEPLQSYFYFLVRSKSAPSSADLAWYSWKADKGSVGHKDITFNISHYSDYYLILGIYREGAIIIDNLKVSEEIMEVKPMEVKSPIFVAKTNKEYNIFSPREGIEIKFSFFPVKEIRDKRLTLKCEVVDFYNKKIKEKVKSFTLKEEKPIFRIHFDNPGFYWVNITLTAEGKEIRKKKLRIAVISFIPRPKLDFASPFGVNQVRNSELANLAGIEWNRQDFSWKSIEPFKGYFNWESLETAVVNSTRMNLLGVLGYAPSWAAKIPSHYESGKGVHAGWAEFPPRDLETWGDYIYRVVNNYKNTVKAWEIWNEPWPNCIFFRGGTIEDYVDLLEIAYKKAKEADPNCIIVGLGGTEYKNMRQVFEAGGYPYMDIVDIHHYQPGPIPPETNGYLEAIKRAREVLREFGEGKEKDLWMTEIGWPTNITDMSIPANWPGISEELQAKYLPRTFVLGIAAGLKKIFWYQFSNAGSDSKNFEQNQGLLTYNLFPKPSFFSYATLTMMLGGLNYKKKIDIGEGIYCYLFEKDEKSCFVLWTLKKGILIGPLLPKGVKVIEMMGALKKVPEKGSKCYLPLSDAVIYVTNDKGNSEQIEKLLQKSKFIREN